MLDKILNINPDVWPSSDGRNPNYRRYGRKTGSDENYNDKDSLVFSPAAAYLSELNWELHNLEYPDKEKIRLEFVINGYLFRFVIDFSTYYTNMFQPMYISRKVKGKKISLIVALAKRKLWFIEHYQNIDFVGLEALFEKISILDDDKKLEENIEVINELSNLEIKLNSELQYILAAVFTFLDKLNKFKIIKRFQFNNNSAELVKLQKVNVQNVR